MKHTRPSIGSMLLLAVAFAAAAPVFVHVDFADNAAPHALVRAQTSLRVSSSFVLAPCALPPASLHVHAHAGASCEDESTHATPVTNRQRLAQLTLLRI